MTLNRKIQQGLSIIELMIAMTLALLIAGAMIMLFSNSKESYNLNENLARLQENGRFAMHLISRDLRWVDYRACTLDIVPLLDNAITGVDGATDSLSITYQLDECPNPGFFVLPSPPTTSTTTYSVATGDSGRPSLFRSVDGAAAEELVEDISDLQVLFGEDTDADDIPNYYVDFDDVSDPARIVAVRLNITAQTPTTVQAAGGAPMTRDFASTIVLRNRIP